MKYTTVYYKKVCPRCGSTKVGGFDTSDGMASSSSQICGECGYKYVVSITEEDNDLPFSLINYHDPRIEKIEKGEE